MNSAPTPPSEHNSAPKETRLQRLAPWLWSMVIYAVVFSIFMSMSFTRTIILGFIQPSSYVDFPLGQNKQIEINRRSYAKHPYCISVLYEFIDAENKLYSANKDQQPRVLNEEVNDKLQNFIASSKTARYQKFMYRFQVIAYDNKNRELLNKEYTNLSQPLNGWIDSSRDRPQNFRYRRDFDCIQLPMGTYRFKIIDKSEPIDEFKEFITSIGVNPDYSLK